MSIPEEAVEAAREAIVRELRRSRRDFVLHEQIARAAIEAATPALEKAFREAIAKEIEAHKGPLLMRGGESDSSVKRAYFSGLRKAARIVQGDTHHE